MEAIWQTSEKFEDGCLYYPIEFIDFLWDHGFVETQTYSKESWRLAFAPFKQPDGLFKLTHDEFLTLDKYRFTGEIHIPFDAMRINEGKYTDEGLDQLFSQSITPSSSFSTGELKEFVNDLKKNFRQPDGLILIKPDAKLKIKKMLEECPSPLRRLELMFDKLLSDREIEKSITEEAQRLSTIATPQQQAALQESTFVSGAASFSEMQARRLKELAKTAAPKMETAELGGEPLKKVKRSKKGIRG